MGYFKKGIPKELHPRWKGGKTNETICPSCKKTFNDYFSNKRIFCSRSCHNDSMRKKRLIYTCVECVKEFEDKENKNRIFCSTRCKQKNKKGNNHYNWKGGKSITWQGYIVLNKNRRKYREHRKVIEDYLGRKLKSEEVVHHINGDKSDNRIKNLQIMDRSSHIALEHKNGVYIEHLKKLNSKHKST